MNRIPNRKLVLGATGLLALAGAGAGGAVAATRTPGPSRRAFADDAAGRLNVSPATLGSAAAAGGFAGRLHVAATYLGLRDQVLRTALESGRSLAEIADATPDRSSAGLRDALLTAAEQRLDKAVAMGWMTRAQQRARLSRLGPRIDKLLARRGLPDGHGLRTP